MSTRAHDLNCFCGQPVDQGSPVTSSQVHCPRCGRTVSRSRLVEHGVAAHAAARLPSVLLVAAA